jgi:hypothetical protein
MSLFLSIRNLCLICRFICIKLELLFFYKDISIKLIFMSVLEILIFQKNTHPELIRVAVESIWILTKYDVDFRSVVVLALSRSLEGQWTVTNFTQLIDIYVSWKLQIFLSDCSSVTPERKFSLSWLFFDIQSLLYAVKESRDE